MGKGQTIRQISEMDSAKIADCELQILKVEFENGTNDLYITLNDESKVGALLAEGFGKNDAVQTYSARHGQFVFYCTGKIESTSIIHATALGAEQSNSAFFVKGKFFFKLFRRLQAGIHPEQEIISQLNKNQFEGVPRLLGHIEYESGNDSYALGILEEHIPDAQNAWDMFTDTQNGDIEFLRKAAFNLGSTTAKMHGALKELKGTPAQAEEVPLEKLISLLQANGKEGLVPIVQEKQFLSQQKKEIPERVREEKSDTSVPMLTPQRIHGDYHLGQLLYKDGKFIVLDFEGEPTRTLEYRRRVRSPAADIAGMLRSFAYANAVRSFDKLRNLDSTRFSENFEKILSEAFLQGYSDEIRIPVDQIKEVTKPYIWGKAIYEACYELEFRPDWFWIPEQALKN